MGNTKSSSSTGCLRNIDANPEEVSLAMMAVAKKIFLKKVHILLLRYAMSKASDDFGMITRKEFREALATANLSGVEIFDLLFTMWDNAADGKVSYKEFCIGISPLACPSDDLPSIVGFALRVSDDANRKYIERKELLELLIGINSTASYFGDVHLLPIDIYEIILAVFERDEIITHEECTKRLATNPYVKRFASGKARKNLRFKDNLETNFVFDKEKLVTEYIVDVEGIGVLSAPDVTEQRDPSPNRDEASTRVPFSDDEDGSCENSGIYGNSMAANGRDPPCVGKHRKQQRSREISYSTYRHAASPPSVSSRDPPQ